MLGRPACGKRTLVQALLAHASPPQAAAVDEDALKHSRGCALDFAYFPVRDPQQNEAASFQDFVCPASCSVWLLEDPQFAPLLRSRITAASLKRCAAVVCIDIKEPSTMMEDLRKWLDVLQ